MRASALGRFVARDLGRTAKTFTVAALGIVAGVATLAFFLGLSEGMRAVVLGRVFPNDRVEVIPPESSVGAALSLLTRSRPPGVDPSQVRALAATPGVRAVLPRMRLAFPSSGRGGRAVFGHDVGVGELLADGVEPSLVTPDLRPGAVFDDLDGRSSHRPCTTDTQCTDGEFCDLAALPRSGQPPPPGQCALPVPAVVSPYLVEVFDGAVAPAHRLPRIGRLLVDRAEGLIFEWDLGRAGLGNASMGTPRRVHARLVGVSPRAIDLGITIPLAVARRFNTEYAGPESASQFSSVVLFLRDPEAMTRASEAVRAQGLTVRTTGAEQMGLLVTAITVILLLTSVVSVVVAALNIAHAFGRLIAERRGEIGLLRALGASQRDIQAIVLCEATAIGFAATALGALVARAAAAGCDHLAATRLPAFPFKPEHWFVFSAKHLAEVFAFGVGACVLSALGPAWRASRVEPAQSLTGGV